MPSENPRYNTSPSQAAYAALRRQITVLANARKRFDKAVDSDSIGDEALARCREHYVTERAVVMRLFREAIESE